MFCIALRGSFETNIRGFMAEEAEVRDVEDGAAPVRKGMKLPILIALIVGIIIVQVGIVMAAIKFFAPGHENPKDKTEKSSEKSEHHADADKEEEDVDETAPGYSQKVEGIVTTKNDLYINPRGGANHIVVVSLGVEIAPEEKVKEVEEKLMVPIQDRVISRISGYTVEELQNSKMRDSLRVIIKNDIKPFFRGMSEEGKEGVKLRNVYFPKFIIQ